MAYSIQSAGSDKILVYQGASSQTMSDVIGLVLMTGMSFWNLYWFIFYVILLLYNYMAVFVILIVTFWEKVVYMYCRCTVTILLIIGFTDYKNVEKIIMVYTLKKNLVNIFQNIDRRCQYCMEWFVLEMQIFNL
jgi:hypothetical protein